MIGLAGPVTRSPHQGISTAWFSIATKSLMVAIMCTDAMQPTGDPAKGTAVGIPYIVANSDMRLVSRMPPDVSGCVWIMSTALFSIRGRNPSEHDELRFTASSILQRSLGQLADQSRTPLEGGRIHVEITAGDTSAGMGSGLTIGIELRIPPGWHIYGPQAGGDYRGLAWRMDSSQCSIIGDTEHPVPRWEQPAFADARLPEYEGNI